MEFQGGYSATGYEVIPDGFSTEALGGVVKTLSAALMRNHTVSNGQSLEELILDREAEDHSQVYRASQSLGSSAAAYNLLGSSGILDAVCDLTGFDPAQLHVLPAYLIVQLPGSEKFDYGWHQDGAYFDWCDELVALWFPVNRAVKEETGTIAVIPGSHALGRRTADTYFRDGFFRQIEAKLEPQEAESQRILELQLGDCCIMDGNLLHRSIANRSATPRIAGVVRLAHLDKSNSYDRERFYCMHKS